MTEHTPGPWQAVFDEDGSWARVEGDIKNGGAYVVAEFDLREAAQYGEKAWLEEGANARLIAAAPDLLAALENLDLAISDIAPELGTQFPSLAEAWTLARAAIAGAKGQ